MSDGESSERRRHARFFVDDASVELRRSGIVALLGLSGLGKVEGVVVNLSETGVRVSVPSRLPSRRKVKCRVRTPRFEDPLEASGLILWCEPDLMSEKSFLVGILFRDLEPRQERKIAAMREWFASPEFKALQAARRP